MSSMQSTENYDQFRSVVSNREIDERHVNQLVIAIRIKNLLHVNPILCNETFDVMDGQHRLEAARRLGVPIYFIVDNHINKQDIATINSNQKNWTTMDYINYWSVEKAPGFDKLSSFLSQHPLIPPTTAMMMFSSGCQRDLKGLRNGVIDTSNYTRACKVADVIKEYRNMIDHAYERNFILAVHSMVRTAGYDHEVMRTKLEFQSRSLVKCISAKQYLELLQEIYNYKSSKHILKFT